MPPKLFSDDGRNVVVRPLAWCGEDEIAQYAAYREFPILPCDLCGSQPDLKRKQIKALLAELERDNPGLRKSMLAALGNAKPSHLHDRDLWERGADPAADDAPDRVGVQRLLRGIRRAPS
jgi:tRNA 2-thiocytidine biosynthesis protein TtcA